MIKNYYMRMKLYMRLIACIVANPKYFIYVSSWADHDRISKQLKKGVVPRQQSFFPTKLDLRITYRCNLRCKMCGQWGTTGTYEHYSADKRRVNLDIDSISQVIEELLPKGLRFVDIEGGETFLHPQVLDLFARLKNRNLVIKPVTNGTILSSYAKEIVSTGVDSIVVSIDGDRETHNNIRGTSWAYDRTMEGIRSLREERRRQKKLLPFVQISYTMSRHNGAGALRRLVDELSGEFLADLFVVKASPIFVPEYAGEAYRRLVEKYFGLTDGISAWEGFKGDYQDFAEEAEEIVSAIQDIQRRVLPFYVAVLPRIDHREIPKLYLDYSWTLHRSHCPIPWVEPTIDSDGNVYPCNLFTDESLSMGSIHKQSFLEIWQGERYQQFRRMLIEQRRGLIPICNRCCQFTER